MTPNKYANNNSKQSQFYSDGVITSTFDEVDSFPNSRYLQTTSAKLIYQENIISRIWDLRKGDQIMILPQPRQLVLIIIALIAIGATSFLGSVRADDFTEITALELKTIMDSGKPVFLLNPLSDLEYNESHIPGSINVSLHTIADSDQLPADLNTPIITYCLGRK